jgi:hypothetical protein
MARGVYEIGAMKNEFPNYHRGYEVGRGRVQMVGIAKTRFT